jgi:hypothetical protein
MGTLGEYLPAYYQQVGTPTKWVPLIIALGSATAALLYWWMHHVEAQLARYQLLIVLACTALFVLSFFGGALTAVIGFFVFTRMLRIVSVNNETQIQHHAPNESRATVGSLYSFVGKVLSAGIIMLIGFSAVGDKVVVPIRWSIMITIVSLVLCVVYFSLKKRSRHSAG